MTPDRHWQQVAWHERRSYWELPEEERRDIRDALQWEAAALARHADQGGRLSRTRGSGHQDEASGLTRDHFRRRRQAQLLVGGDP